MKPRLIPIIIGVILALAAAMMINGYLGEERAKLRKLQVGMEPVGVLVAKQDLPAQQVLTEELVELVGIPEKYLQPHAIAKPALIVGRVTLAPIARGEQILATKLARPESGGGTLAARTPPGMRAVTLNLDPVGGLGGFVQPGNHVDILWTALVPQPGGASQAITLTVVQHALVLAVGTAAASGLPVTFALLPSEIEVMLFAQEQGKLQLAMRSAGEDAAVDVEPPPSLEAVKAMIFGVQRAQPAQREVEIYRGLNKAVVSVPEPEQP